MSIKLYTDGACRGNPGPGGAGAVINRIGKKKRYLYYYVGDNTTNNVAEYTAVVLALEYLVREGIKEEDRIVLYTDSNLIVQQMSGKWQVKNEKLKPLYKEAMKYLLELGVSWSIKWVKGHSGDEDNEKADYLANLAIDSNKPNKSNKG